MKSKKTVIIIIVEGQSEIAYFNELNRFFREESVNAVFYPVKAVNGLYKEVKKTYRRVKREQSNSRIEILVDRDIYIRSPLESSSYLLREKDGLPYFRFSYMNHEDFLILHQTRRRAERWNSIMKDAGHDIIPLTAKEYMAEIYSSRIWGGVHYKKGEVPFRMSWERIENLISNDRESSIFLHSDITDVLLEVIPPDKLSSKYGKDS